MNEIVDLITNLDADRAICLLQTLAMSDPDFHHHSQDLSGLEKIPLTTDQQSNLARETLLALAAESTHQAEAIKSLLVNLAPPRFGVGTAAATLILVVAVLRSRIKVERDKKGKWAFLFEHKAIDNDLLLALVKKLQSLLEQ